MSDLDVTLSFDAVSKIIVLQFAEGERNISVGFTIAEAQLLNTQLADTISEAILGPVLTLVPPPSETKH